MNRAMSVRRWARTPKGLLTIVLVMLVAIAAPYESLGTVAPGLLSGILAAGVIDASAGRLDSLTPIPPPSPDQH